MANDPTAAGNLSLTFAKLTNTGDRAANEDALAYACQDDLTCFVVSDGVGGYQGGAIAANIITDAIIERFVHEASFGSHALRSYIDYAAVQLAERKSGEPQLKDMSATVAAVLIDQTNRLAVWAHIGDTRIYRFHRGRRQMVTKDHSLVQQFIDAGYCDPEELRTHPQRHALFAALGAGTAGIAAEVTLDALPVQSGDAFLICTDGFWEWIDDDDMERTAQSTQTAEEWLQAMRIIVEKNVAVSTTLHDNYSAFAIVFAEH